MTEFNDRAIAEFRGYSGRGDAGGFGTNLVLIHSIGARSGLERVKPTLSLKDAGRLVIASSAGRPNHPGWYHNLRAHPDITIETLEDAEKVTTIELVGEQYTAAWRRLDADSRAFARHQQSPDRAGFRSSAQHR